MTDAPSAGDRERLEELFERAADLPPEERAAFVDRECPPGSPLRAEMHLLLDGLEGEDRLTRGAPLPVGTRIGSYRILERIGEGGMGEVYAAEQREPVVRRVALKVIKPGMDSAQVVARFEFERQALALMTHPNVAQILDGGTTPDGRPFFVMEYVAGEPVTEYCDRRALTTRERLELFLRICAGVQHAHQKGLIHRDMKPSNLLVTEQDGRALPKVIDFGVARATTGSLAERTLYTMVGQIVGTLDYMSPEQADPSDVDVDTRSDVYSLGVVLYELLSGLLPFGRDSMAGRALSEVQRTIRETDPPRPSTRLRRETRAAASVAPLHGTDARSLIRQLAGDLDWISLRALEKDPSRRYQSVAELADDVRRYLSHQPVLAGRPGLLYRARKFARRHRIAVAAGVLVAAGVGTGIAGILAARVESLASERLRPARDDVELQQLITRADEELWPPTPEKIDAMRTWLADAKSMVPRLEGYRVEWAELRERALPWSPEERKQDAESHPMHRELVKGKLMLDRSRELVREGNVPEGELAEHEKRIRELEQAVPALQAEVEARRTWRFASTEDQYWHGLMSSLVDGLHTLTDEATGLLSPEGVSLEHGWSVPKRIAVAGDLLDESVEGPLAALSWEKAIASIRDRDACPRYDGLEIVPQLGLLPIRRDPVSGLWEFAHLLSGERAQSDEDGKLMLTPRTGMVLVLLPGGTFWMGAQSEDPHGHNFAPDAIDFLEGPVHEDRVEPFFVSKFEMTRAQWWRSTHEVRKATAKVPEEPSDLRPMDLVSWIACDTVVRRLGLRLPHERQWEYATRAGTETPWSTGATEETLQDHANLYDQAGYDEDEDWLREAGDVSTIDDGSLTMTNVGTYLPNDFGLYDTHGNVAEWCDNTPYQYAPDLDLALAEQPSQLERMVRGGNARYPANPARSAFRRSFHPSLRGFALGLRPVRELDERRKR